ncbi:MAG: glycosyltransferase family 4 protein [Spirochaetales bacterium]|nr:glycosyltransferase family 4 protein [Spirochaetales bacterium]
MQSPRPLTRERQVRAGAAGALTIAFLSPAWPKAASYNGIVSYTTQMYQGLRDLGDRPLIIAQELHEHSDGDDVFWLDAFGARGLLRRARDRLLRNVAAGYCHATNLADAIVRRVNQLTCERELQLLQMEESFGWAHRVAGRLSVPLVVRLHGPWFLVGPASDASNNAAFRRKVAAEGRGAVMADGVTAASANTLDAFRLHYQCELALARVIPNAISLPPGQARWSLENTEPERIVFIGRFDACKGGDVVIRAFVSLSRRRPKARLTFVGPDLGVVQAGRKVQLRELVQSLLPGALDDGRIENLGFQAGDALWDLRRRAAVVLAPSRFENFPNVVLEALCLGAPVIATGVGGTPEIITHGQDGLLVEAGSDEGLARAMETMLANPEAAAAMGEQAFKRSLDYRPEAIARLTHSFYEEVIDRFQRRRGKGHNL